MKRKLGWARLAPASLVALATLLSPSAASAAAQSTRDPFYVQGTFLGFGSGLNGARYYSSSVYRVEFEFGYHPTGRHDGFAIGFRQGFYLGSAANAGFTAARLGYDIPILVKGGRMEVTIAPYGALGIAYPFAGGNAAANIAFGAEGRFFPIANNGFFALAKPFEITILASSGTSVSYGFGLGCGYAF